VNGEQSLAIFASHPIVAVHGDRLQATSISFPNNNAHSLSSVLDIMKYGEIDLCHSKAGSSGSKLIKDDISTASHR
jgi:hypothetical protein